jgi:acyl carrier protein
MTSRLDAIALRLQTIVAEMADLPPDDIHELTVVFGRSPDGASGLLDSLDALKLVLLLEAEYGIDLPLDEGTPVYTLREVAEAISRRSVCHGGD